MIKTIKHVDKNYKPPKKRRKKVNQIDDNDNDHVTNK